MTGCAHIKHADSWSLDSRLRGNDGMAAEATTMFCAQSVSVEIASHIP